MFRVVIFHHPVTVLESNSLSLKVVCIDFLGFIVSVSPFIRACQSLYPSAIVSVRHLPFSRARKEKCSQYDKGQKLQERSCVLKGGGLSINKWIYFGWVHFISWFLSYNSAKVGHTKSIELHLTAVQRT